MFWACLNWTCQPISGKMRWRACNGHHRQVHAESFLCRGVTLVFSVALEESSTSLGFLFAHINSKDFWQCRPSSLLRYLTKIHLTQVFHFLLEEEKRPDLFIQKPVNNHQKWAARCWWICFISQLLVSCQSLMNHLADAWGSNSVWTGDRGEEGEYRNPQMLFNFYEGGNHCPITVNLTIKTISLQGLIKQAV